MWWIEFDDLFLNRWSQKVQRSNRADPVGMRVTKSFENGSAERCPLRHAGVVGDYFPHHLWRSIDVPRHAVAVEPAHVVRSVG